MSHYSNATTDIEFLFPFGWGELWGIADRTDFGRKEFQKRLKEPKEKNKDTKKLEYLFTFSQEVVENDGKFLDNQFYDVYLIEMDLDISSLKLQEEEVSEVKNIYYKDFETMINNKDKDIVNHPEEWKRLFKILHQRYDNKK